MSTWPASCLVFLAAGMAFASSYGCPDGWISFGSSCYKVSPGKMNWHQAKQYCSRNRAQLVDIETQAEQQSLSHHLPTNLCYWTGLNDHAREGEYVWGSGRPARYTNWGPGQPDNNRDEDCVQMCPGPDFRWNDLTCSHDSVWGRNVHALCETPMTHHRA